MTIVEILWLLITGLVVGALARLVIPGRQAVGLLTTTLLGVAGTLGGGYLASRLTGFGPGGRFVVAVGVAAVLLLIVEGARGRR